jgi:signal transduction histidine kinase
MSFCANYTGAWNNLHRMARNLCAPKVAAEWGCMVQREILSDDSRDLRRCLRDLVALSALPAVWIGYDTRRIAESLADVLLGLLRLDFIYVCVKTDRPDVSLEVARTEEGLHTPGQAQLLRRALAPWLNVQGYHPPVSLHNPFGSGSVRVAIIPLGIGAEHGVLIAGSRRLDFATEAEYLPLTVGANQAALLFGRLRAEAAVQRAYAELEHRMQERTAALDREMAERRRLEHEAQRAEHFALLGRLAAGVSHEIRNPLGAIFLHVDLLEEELREPSPDGAAVMSAALAEIKTQLARLDDLVQDYLSLVRVANISRTPQDVGAAVRAWAEEWQGLTTACGVTLRLEGLTDLGLVALHESMLRRAVLNLLQNALDAMPQGGTLTLSGQSTATHVQLQVRDTGSGISAENLRKIFEPLYTTKPGGTGLGLYIVQEIMAAHEGGVSVDSVRGQGTTFTLTLPRAVDEAPASMP